MTVDLSPLGKFSKKCRLGFTLAELLIALLILGEIATFTIPKILTAQQNGQRNAAAKEVIAAVSAAYQSYTYTSGTSGGTTFGNITPYLNYVAVDTTSSMDDHVGANANYTCAGRTCLKMHTGGVLFPAGNATSFGGTNTTNAILLYYDPDGTRSGVGTDGPGKSVAFFLYYNGATTTRGTMRPNTTDSNGVHGAWPTAEPSWFSW